MSLKALKNALNAVSLKVENLPRIPTGILSLDLVLGGGFPIRRASEIYGWSLSGKTYLMLRVSRIFQDLSPNNFIVWFDREGALEKCHLESLNIDEERFIWLPPRECATVDILEDKFKSAFDGLSEEENVLFVIDSIGAYVKDEKSIAKTASDMGNVAKGVKNFLRIAGNFLDQTTVSMLLIANHLYLDPNNMGAVKKSGGTGLDFLRTCGLALQVTKEGDVKSADTTGYFLWAVAEKTRLLKGDTPSKTCLYMDKGGYGIHPLSGLYYYLGTWGKLTPTNKDYFARPTFKNNPVYAFPNIEKAIKVSGEKDYNRVLSFLDKYGKDAGIPEGIITKAHEYVEKYNFHLAPPLPNSSCLLYT